MPENNNSTQELTYSQRRKLEQEQKKKKQEEINKNVQTGTYTADDYLPTSESTEDKSKIYQFSEKEGIQLFESTEGKIVPYLQERFKNVLTTPERKGFTFEETGAFVDRIKVTAPNGKTIVISADNFFEKNNIKSTNQFNAFMLENSGGMSTEAVESTYENKLVNDLVNIQEGNTLTEEQKLQAREDAENDFAGGFFAGIGEKAREFGLDLITQQSGLGLSPTTSQNLGRIVSGFGRIETLDPTAEALKKSAKYYDETGGKHFIKNEDGSQAYDEEGNALTRDVTEEDLTNKAKEFKTEEYIERLKQKEANDYNSEKGNITEVATATAQRKVDHAQRILDDPNYKRVEALGESVSIDYENYNNEVEKLNDKLSSSPVWARRFSAQEVTNINNLQNQLNNKIKLYDNVVKPYKEALLEKEKFEKAEDQLDNIAGSLTSMGYNFLTSSEDALGSAAWLAGSVPSMIFNAVDENLGTNWTNAVKYSTAGMQMRGLREIGRVLKNDAEERKTELKQLPKGYNGLLDFAEKGVNGVMENLPLLSVGIASGGGSVAANMAVFGASGMSTKHFEMTKEIEQGKASYTANQLIMAPTLYGIAESATMAVETYALQGKFNIGKNLFGKSFLGKVGRTASGYTGAAGGEVIEESFTNVGQNAVDKYILGKKDVNLYDGFNADFFAKVVGSAVTFQTLGNAKSYIGSLAYNLSATENMQPVEVRNSIIQGSKDILNTHIKIGDLKNQLRFEPNAEQKNNIELEIDVLETKRKQQEVKQQETINSALDFSKIGTNGVNKLRTFAKEQSALQQKLAGIKQALNLSPQQKQELIEVLKVDFDAIEAKKSKIINNDNKYQLEGNQKVSELETQAKESLLEKNNGKQPSEQQIQDEAEAIYDNENFVTEKNAKEAETIMKNQVAKLESETLIEKVNQIDPSKPINKLEATSLPEVVQALEVDMESKGYAKDSEQTQKAVQEVKDNWDNSAATMVQPEVLKNGEKVLNPELHTFDKHQTIVVNKKKADTDPNFAARGHELFHGVLWKAFKSSGQGFKPISDALVKHLSESDQEGSKWLSSQLTQLDPNSYNYHEEVITNIADGMRNGDIKISPSMAKTIGNTLRTAAQKLNIDTKLFINNPADMFDLIASYNKNLKSDGRLSGALKSALEQGVVVDPKLQPKRQIKPDQRITKQYKDEKAFENKIQKLYEEGKIDDILESYKPRVSKMLEAEYKNFLIANNAARGTAEYQLIIDEVLSGRRGIMEEIMKYKPGKVPLSGYIGSIMKKRGISEQVFAIVPDTSGMYKQEIDAQTRQIADEIIEEIVETKKELLKETINLDPSILNEVVNAVTKTFGTNLGDITSPQFKKKLADNFRLQLFKTIKNMLGKRVDYKNYLENNWESIWKSLPQDIVNKRFPQLIDKVETTEGKQARAKTKAGRRVFKKKNLTRQEFMDYFLGDDVGASTKGTRKDGLSSAIAETLARDEVMDVLSNPEVASKFEEINKVLELKLPKNWKSYVQKAIDAIDNLSNELNNTAGFMGTPQMMSVFTKALSAGLKAGKNFIDSVIDAIEALRKIYKKGLNPQEQQWTDDHFNHVIEEIRKYMKEPTTESEMKQRLEEIFDPENPIWNVNEQDVNSSQQFMNQMKELAKTDAKIKAVLESQGNKSIWLGSPSKITEDNVSPLDNFAKETDAFLKRIPQSFFNNMLKIKNISKSNLFGFAGQHYNLLDDRGTAKGQLGNYFDILQGRDTSTSPIDTKAAVEAGVMSKETAKAIDDIQWDKVEMMLIKRDKNGKVKSGPLLTKMIDIAEGPGTVAEKKKAIDAAMDSEVGVENIKAFKAIAMMMKDAYNAGTISDSYLLNNLQGQTNVAYSFRSLSKFGGIQLKDGPQPGLINLGEHMNPNSGTMDGLMNWIRDKNSTETQLDEIADKHEQIYGDGRTAKDKNGNINYKDSGTLKKVDLKNPKTGLKLPQTSKLGIERYSKTLTEAEQQSIYFPARGSKVGINLRERIAIERLQKKSIETNKKSAEKVNQQTFGDMDAKTRKNWDKARELARDPNQPQKGITIVDFDDTLATSNSKVIVNMPDGTTKKITPAEFAKQHAALESEDAKFDFSEFNKVIGGKPGPFFNKVQKLADKFGTEQIHILTARPQASAAAIQAFMKGLGIDINIDNIVGLEDGRPEAKRDFIIKKAAEGFNDFLFADDVTANTKAVQQVLDALDIKSDIRTEDKNFKRDLNLEFNKIIEQNKGLDRNAVVSEARAKSKGAKRGNWFTNFFLAPSAEDFAGLLYTLLGKGKKGEQQWAFLKKALIDPFARGIRDLNAFKQVLANELKALKDLYPEVTKSLRKNSGVGDYNNAHAIRVYNWNKAGYTAADLGISQTDFNNLIKVVEANSDMKAFADGVRPITKVKEGYPAPKDSWIIGNIDTDMQDVGNTAKRSEFLKEFNDNVEQIFTPENIRKLELIYGSKFTEALDDMLYRMQYGTNRSQGSSRIVNQWQNWVNNSVGAIMFFNMRSSFLQTLSSVNFMNWSDNNPLMAAKAFANQKQFWKDFSFIFNHPTLKQRRAGLDIDVNASEIAKRVQESNNPVSAALSYLLQIGFTPTRIADSFAIAIGGASMYRNRINTYKKKGLSDAEAADKAFLDFQEISEATQQSARPDMISQQQASVLGRLILAFQVTPMQYARLIKRSIQDLAAGRGDRKTHISKILYYGAAQNILFNSLQSALFALAYGTDDEEEDEKLTDKEKRKLTRIANNSVDSLLRGLGVQGAAVATIKNMVIKFLEQEKRGYRADHAYTLIEGLNISPPIGSKARKVYGGTQSYKFNREAIKEMGLDIDNPAYDAVSNIVSGTTNLPLDRVLANINNLRGAIDKRNQAWQRIALLMGWNTWDVGIPDREVEKVKQEIKKRKAEERKRKKSKK